MVRRQREHSPLIIAGAWSFLCLAIAAMATLAGCATAPEPEPVGNIACWETVTGLVCQAYPLGEEAPTPPEDALVWV